MIPLAKLFKNAGHVFLGAALFVSFIVCVLMTPIYGFYRIGGGRPLLGESDSLEEDECLNLVFLSLVIGSLVSGFTFLFMRYGIGQ